MQDPKGQPHTLTPVSLSRSKITSALMGCSRALVWTSLPSVSIMMPTENLRTSRMSPEPGTLYVSCSCQLLYEAALQGIHLSSIRQ